MVRNVALTRETAVGRECDFATAPGSCPSMREAGRARAAFSGHGQFTLPATSSHTIDQHIAMPMTGLRVQPLSASDRRPVSVNGQTGASQYVDELHRMGGVNHAPALSPASRSTRTDARPPA